MTESAWLACAEPRGMLFSLTRNSSRRKEQLFAVACCRRIDHLLDDYCRELLDRVEASADQPLSVAANEELISDATAKAAGLFYYAGTTIGSAAVECGERNFERRGRAPNYCR